MMDHIALYLGTHAVITVGAIIGFLIRTEHRITKLETTLTILKDSHDALTNMGTLRHGIE